MANDAAPSVPPTIAEQIAVLTGYRNRLRTDSTNGVTSPIDEPGVQRQVQCLDAAITVLRGLRIAEPSILEDTISLLRGLRDAIDTDPLDRPLITLLDFAPTRLRNIINDTNLTVADLVSKYSPGRVYKIRNMGRKSFSDLLDILRSINHPDVERWVENATVFLASKDAPRR